VSDLEVLIVGDGMDETTRTAAMALCAQDPRVRLFEFPKDARRGERNRHELLSTEARGRIVAYLCDRDLWLPDHLEELDRVLRESDFGHTLRYRVGRNDDYWFLYGMDLRDPKMRDPAALEAEKRLVPLSMAGHTLSAYRRLPYGWRTTPADVPTDAYMWRQFLEQPWVRVGVSPMPTVLTFKRGDHPGLSTEGRREILVRWSARLAEPGAAATVQREVLDALWHEWRRLDSADRRRPTERLRRSAARVARRFGLR
jgi:hypothetical protein